MKELISVLFLLVSFSVFAQKPHEYHNYISNNKAERCLSGIKTDQIRNANEDQIRKIQNAVDLANRNRNLRSSSFSDSIVRIPVVFHIIHNNGPENISNAQIESQVRILNEDYRKISGTNGFGNGVDTRFEFFLAQKDTAGNCTNGIVRIQNSETSHNYNNETVLKGLSQWDPNRYLNVWVVDEILFQGFPGVLGYATLPQWLPNSPNRDGIVCADEYIGDIGTVTQPFDFGRTATHEVGHWLGLYHTFEGVSGCSGIADSTCFSNAIVMPVNAGDGVCDTPPAGAPAVGCPNKNTCNENITVLNGDVNDQVENYMDYSDDVCMNTFTQGQMDRMNFFTSAFRSTLLDSMNAINAGLFGCDQALTANISGFDTVCIGDDFTMTFNLTGNPPFDVVYTNGLTNDTLSGIFSPFNKTISALQGTTTYSIVSVADQDSIKISPDAAVTGSAAVTANFPGVTDAGLSSNGSICQGDSGQITFTINGGTGPFNVEINKGVGQLTGLGNNSIIQVIPADTSAYDIVNLTDINGCSTTNFNSSANFNFLPKPTATFQTFKSANNVTFTNASQGAISYFWDFGDGNTSTQQNPVHTYQNTGQFNARLISTNNLGCSDSTLEVLDISTLSNIVNSKLLDPIRIFPNPASDEIRISGLERSSSKIEIYDLLGKQYRFKKIMKEENLIIDISHFAPGLYILKVSDGARQLTEKVLIEQ